MLREGVSESDRLNQLHLIQDLFWSFHFLVPHHVAEFLSLIRRGTQLLILRKCGHVILLKDKHPVAVVRECLFHQVMLLRILQQVLTHRLQPLDNLRVNRRQTECPIFRLHLLKPLANHRLGYLFRCSLGFSGSAGFDALGSFAGSGVLLLLAELNYWQLKEFRLIRESMRKLTHVHTHGGIQVLFPDWLILHQIHEILPKFVVVGVESLDTLYDLFFAVVRDY